MDVSRTWELTIRGFGYRFWDLLEAAPQAQGSQRRCDLAGRIRPGPYFFFFDLYNSGTNSWSHNQVRSLRKPYLLNPAKSSKCTAISTSIPPCYNGIGYDLRAPGMCVFSFDWVIRYGSKRLGVLLRKSRPTLVG